MGGDEREQKPGQTFSSILGYSIRLIARVESEIMEHRCKRINRRVIPDRPLVGGMLELNSSLESWSPIGRKFLPLSPPLTRSIHLVGARSLASPSANAFLSIRVLILAASSISSNRWNRTLGTSRLR